MNKKILILFCVFCSFIFNITAIQAGCYDESACENKLLLCSYQIINDSDSPINYDIYYDTKDGEYSLHVISSTITTMGTSYSDSFPHKKIYSKFINTLNGDFPEKEEEFTCPTHAYQNPRSKNTCFDYDGKWCLENYYTGRHYLNNVKKSSKVTYDVYDQIKTYFEGNDEVEPTMFASFCDKIKNKELDISSNNINDSLIDDLEDDFNNFLKGDKIPKSIEKARESYFDSIAEKYRDKAKDECIEEIKSTDDLTDEEKEEMIEVVDQNPNASELKEKYNVKYHVSGINISGSSTTCEQLLGKNLVKVVKFCVKLVCIAGAIIAIVNGMIILLPAVAKKDSDELKKSEKKLVSLAIILVLIILLPVILKVLGLLFNYDLTCFSWK